MNLEGKRGVIMGVANRRSIAWAVAQACGAAGARLALTYAGERLEKDVRGLAEALEDPVVVPCDVTDDASIDAAFETIGAELGGVDFLVHAIAFANRDDLARPFVETSRDGYHLAQDVSSYSLTAVARRAAPLMEAAGGGAIVTMTYAGATRVVPGYNVMGVAKAALEASVRYLAHDLGEKQIRVNALSAGPIKTLAARGIRNFTKMMEHHREIAPMRRNVEVEEVADATLFLVSPASRGVTGQVLFVDAGSHIL